MVTQGATLQVVIFAEEWKSWTKTAVEDYLTDPKVLQVVVATNEPQSSVEKIFEEINDERVVVYSNPKPMGEGAAWKAMMAKNIAPTTIIHGMGVCSKSEKIDVLVKHLVDGTADAVFATANNSENGHRVTSFRSTTSNKFCTSVANMGSNLNISDLFESSIIIRSDLLEALALEQDGIAVRVELTTKLAAMQPTVKIFEIGVGSSPNISGGSSFSSRKNAKSALWGAIRYSKLGQKLASWRATPPLPSEDPDHVLTGVLEDLSEMENYPQWIVGLLKDELGPPILEVGAGHGSITKVLADYGNVVAFDTSEVATKVLNEKFSENKQRKHQVLVVDSLEKAEEHGPYQAIVLVNVLEHVANDVQLLEDLAEMLTPTGVIAIFTPAHPELYSQFDGLVGHYRRYRLGEISIVMRSSGLKIEKLKYVNAVGAVGWLVNSRLLRSTTPSPFITKIYDKLIFIMTRIVDPLVGSRFGQSVVCIASKSDNYNHRKNNLSTDGIR